VVTSFQPLGIPHSLFPHKVLESFAKNCLLLVKKLFDLFPKYYLWLSPQLSNASKKLKGTAEKEKEKKRGKERERESLIPS
jgi:hypothetical protein